MLGVNHMKNTIPSNQKPQIKKVLLALGGLIALSTYAVVILFIVLEAKEVLSKGLSVFISDTLLRAFFGLVIAGLAGLPYFLGAVAVSKAKQPLFIFLTCWLIFALDICARVQVIFSPTSSTSSIAILFLPFVFAFLVLIVWAITSIVSRYHESHNEESR